MPHQHALKLMAGSLSDLPRELPTGYAQVTEGKVCLGDKIWQSASYNKWLDANACHDYVGYSVDVLFCVIRKRSK